MKTKNNAALIRKERLKLLSGDGWWKIHDLDEDHPGLEMHDGPCGIRRHNDKLETIPSICYPAPCLLSCSWDKELYKEIGEMMGSEARANQTDMLLCPGVNIKRNPLCGRNFEYIAEDPLLAGSLASSFIEGMQSQGVGACIKHFACNSQEYYRFFNDSVIDERTLHELYLKPFEIAIKESKPWAVMASYNRINGYYACSNKYLLKNVLKGKWGYDGVVMSDWGACEDPIICHNAGMDLEMPVAFDRNKYLNKALQYKTLDASEVDDSIKRIMSLLEKNKDSKQLAMPFDEVKARELCVKAITKSAVLLRNENKALPLKDFDGVCIIGELAHTPRYQGGGSSKVNAKHAVSFIKALSKRTGKPVPFAPGYNIEADTYSPTLVADAVDLASRNKTVLLFLGLPNAFESEGRDRRNMLLPDNQRRLVDALYQVNQNIIVVLSCGAPVELPFREKVKAILLTYLTGGEFGYGIMPLLLGEVSPSGKLSESWPIHYSDCPSFGFYPGSQSESLYRESIYVGYRYYLSCEKEVAYPFGHGLSYANIEIGKVAISRKKIDEGQSATLSVELTNKSSFAAEKVVEVYLSKKESNVFRPKRVLLGYAKTNVLPKKSKKVTIKIDYSDLSFYDVSSHSFQVEKGTYEIEVGNSSSDIVSVVKIEANGKEYISQRTSLAIYYKPLKTGFINYESAFECLLGHPLRLTRNTKMKPYTLNSTFSDIAGTGIGKKLRREFLRSLPEDKRNDPNIIAEEDQYPIRVKNNVMPLNKVQVIVDLANDKPWAALRHKLFGKKPTK